MIFSFIFLPQIPKKSAFFRQVFFDMMMNDSKSTYVTTVDSQQRTETMHMKTICILSGTDRPGSAALKIANYIKPLYEARGVTANVVSLEDFPVEETIGGKYGQKLPRVEAYRNKVIGADGIVMIIPEYNGSFPGILKLFIDYLPFPDAFFKKPVAFIGEAAGAFGGLRAVEQMQMICAYRNALLHPDRVFLQRVTSTFDEKEGIRDHMMAKLLRDQIESFSQLVKGVKDPQPV